MIHWVIYEYLKKVLAKRQELERIKRRSDERTSMDFIGFMVCGATSKTCATCVAYPHGKHNVITPCTQTIQMLMLLPSQTDLKPI